MTIQTSPSDESDHRNEADDSSRKPGSKGRAAARFSKELGEYLAGLTYLIVDDCRFDRKVIREALSLFGARRCREAEDAVGAMKMLSQEPVDLVLTDYEMPLATGVELTRMIRNSTKVLNPEVPVIIVSGFSEQFRIGEAMAAGIAEYVVKPFASDRLLTHVVRALDSVPPTPVECPE